MWNIHIEVCLSCVHILYHDANDLVQWVRTNIAPVDGVVRRDWMNKGASVMRNK